MDVTATPAWCHPTPLFSLGCENLPLPNHLLDRPSCRQRSTFDHSTQVASLLDPCDRFDRRVCSAKEAEKAHDSFPENRFIRTMEPIAFKMLLCNIRFKKAVQRRSSFVDDYNLPDTGRVSEFAHDVAFCTQRVFLSYEPLDPDPHTPFPFRSLPVGFFGARSLPGFNRNRMVKSSRMVVHEQVEGSDRVRPGLQRQPSWIDRSRLQTLNEHRCRRAR
jgi:hypothetical protein